MARYYLVGRYYDRERHDYIDKIIIEKINGEKLLTLKKIDEFTSSHSQTEIFNMIKSEYNRDDFSFLSIMYLRDNNSKPYYNNTIIDDYVYSECIGSADYVVKNIEGVTRKILFIDVNSSLYKQEVSKFLDVLKSNVFEKFEEVYPYKNTLHTLVWRYMTASYDNELEKEKDLNLILLEFSRYKTFRDWYVQQKKSKYRYVSSNKGVNKVQKSVDIVKKSGEKESIEETVKKVESDFLKEHGVTYRSYQTEEFNKETEEFLDEEEAMEMFDYENSRVKKRY